MSRKCGQIRQASSDTTVRPTRQVSDTKNFFSATTVAASSYGLKTLRGALVSHFPDTETPCLARMSVIPHMRTGRTHRRRSATKRCPSCRTGAAPGSISPFPQDSQSPPPALARSRFHSTLSSSCSVAATRQFDTPQIRNFLLPATTGVESSYDSLYTVSWLRSPQVAIQPPSARIH